MLIQILVLQVHFPADVVLRHILRFFSDNLTVCLFVISASASRLRRYEVSLHCKLAVAALRHLVDFTPCGFGCRGHPLLSVLQDVLAVLQYIYIHIFDVVHLKRRYCFVLYT